jgi:hypothetical protein
MTKNTTLALTLFSCAFTACVLDPPPDDVAETQSALCSPITCNDHNPCTVDTCVGSSCWHRPVVCLQVDQCHTGFCSPLNGTCSYPNKPDGTTCDDGNLCTQTDTCQAGTCTGGNPVVCVASDPDHEGFCDKSVGVCEILPCELDSPVHGWGEPTSFSADPGYCSNLAQSLLYQNYRVQDNFLYLPVDSTEELTEILEVDKVPNSCAFYVAANFGGYISDCYISFFVNIASDVQP